MQGQQLEAFAQQLARLTQSNEQRFEQLRVSVETRLGAIQSDNASKLEEMRKTVDEKLHATLEQRLGESFKLVSERLEQLHKGLGEMQTLAAGVGDLKKVLTNVKTRGTWGEVQLEALLDQVLTAEQYEKNVCDASGSNERVEFAIRFAGAERPRFRWPSRCGCRSTPSSRSKTISGSSRHRIAPIRRRLKRAAARYPRDESPA